MLYLPAAFNTVSASTVTHGFIFTVLVPPQSTIEVCEPRFSGRRPFYTADHAPVQSQV